MITGRPVKFELTDQTRETIDLRIANKEAGEPSMQPRRQSYPPSGKCHRAIGSSIECPDQRVGIGNSVLQRLRSETMGSEFEFRYSEIWGETLNPILGPRPAPGSAAPGSVTKHH